MVAVFPLWEAQRAKTSAGYQWYLENTVFGASKADEGFLFEWLCSERASC